ncbi:MAG: prepilin-type N-terminal cleavage/methylation domain-containing protein [Planctomycetota bacterium]|nr:MAG: prepilin-type N-terminal cleavage/methylation domain-containing protein [Planctomycetota bacterium]
MPTDAGVARAEARRSERTAAIRVLPATTIRRDGFTLIELLVVISIISLLISILLPSLSRARDQAKAVHCLARLKEIGTALATYENISGGLMPPARWYPAEEDLDPPDESTAVSRNGQDGRPRRIEYGWAEILFRHVYREEVRVPVSYPVLRNVEGRRWEKYFLCKAAGEEGVSSGHYRVYLPAWVGGRLPIRPDGRYELTVPLDPSVSGRRDAVRPKLPLIGDANIESERGDGLGDDDCSYIDAGEANIAGSNGRNGNRFSDRHYGGTNYLFQDLHGAWRPRLREELARDFDLNGVIDIDAQP